jgi:hypothetical protein
MADDKKPLDLQQERYAQAESLEKAIDLLKDYLREQKLSVYAPLFSRESVTSGIQNSLHAIAVRSQLQAEHGKQFEDAGDNLPRQKGDYFKEVVAPVCRQVAEGKWPKNVYFYCMPPNPRFSTFSVNLVVDLRKHDLGGYEFAPGKKPTAYGINVVMLNYGLEPRLKGGPTGTVVLERQ